MSKASSLEQRAKKKLAELEAELASFKDAQVDLEHRMVAVGIKIKDLSCNIEDVLYILNGDKPEPPAMTGTAAKPPSEVDAPRQKRKYTRKTGWLTAQSSKESSQDATDAVRVVRAKAKDQKTQEALPLATHYCYDCASNVAVTVKIVKGEEQTTCRECGSLQVELIMSKTEKR